jgi:hypothetical protein
VGWQDAPLASPTGPKPAWSSAPLATQSNAPAGGAVPEDPRGDYFSGDGFLSRVGNFIHRADQMSERGAHNLVSGLERTGQAAANAVGFDNVGSYLGSQAAENETASAAPVPGSTSWEDVKAHPNAGNIASFIGEQAAGATPSLGAAAVALPVFGLSRLGDIAHQRAVNDLPQANPDALGSQPAPDAAPTIMDLLKAAPSAAIDTALMRGGLGAILKGGVAKAAVREGLAMGGMPVADYAGETVGTNKGFNPAEAADQAAAGLVAGLPLGAGMHLGVRGVRALREVYATKGVDTSGISDEALTEGSLNGSIHPDVGPNQVNEILASVGSSPEHFSTPERAAAAADRAAAAAARPNLNDLGAKEVGRQQGIRDDIAAGDTHPAWASAPVERTVPDVTVIHAAPEGLVRSDDQGGQVGLSRHNSAQQNVLGTAERHAERDPVLRHVLDSDMPLDTKIGVLMDRFRSRFPEVDLGEDAAPTPFQEPTADRARTHRLEPHSQLERELAAVEDTESHGDPNAVSKKGARGSMQTMSGTLRDPGYGVRPAQNDSPEELRRVGRDYYAALRAHYGDAAKAFAAYNAGPGALDGAVKKYGADWLAHLPEETRNYVRMNLGKTGGEPAETVYRGPAPSEDPFRSDSGFERTDAPEEPLERTGAGESRMATGDSSRPFREETDTPEGEEPGYWERRAEMHADDLRKEWEASRQEPPSGGEDPASQYGKNNYGQRPHMPEGSDAFAMTPEGHIADVNGKPVAFRTVKEAAKFAAKNKLGGDFEPKVWTANSTRVVLTRRPGSSYGERPARPEGPQEPPAGRTADTSQRLIPDWQKAPVEPAGAPSARDTGSEATEHPKSATGAVEPVSDALRGSVSDPNVSHETENVPAGPERFDETPPPTEADIITPGTFERSRPDPADLAAPEPKKPRNFASAVIDYLGQQSRKSGLRHRINAEDAINFGVPADAIYVNPKAKYPSVKVHLQRLFANPKAPLQSKAQPAKLHSLDHLGDVFDADQFGVPSGDGIQEHRIAPEHIGELLRDSLHKHESAWDRSDPNFEKYNEWSARHFAAAEFADRYGDRWHEMPDEELDRIDAEERGPFDDLLDDVLGEHDYGAPPRPFADQEAHSEGVGEGEGGVDGRSPESTEASGRGASAEDALFPARETDQRDSLQRKADEGLKPSAEQKAPGSDGGLFDTRDTTGNIFKDLWDDESGALNIGPIADLIFEKDSDPAAALKALRDAVKTPVKTTKAALRALDHFGSVVAYSSDGSLRTLARHYNSPTIAKLADMFQARAGAPDATGRTYDEALKRQNGRFRSVLDKALDPFIDNKAAMERIRDLLADPDRSVQSTASERAAAVEIRNLLKDVIDYRRDAGEDIGEVKNYFPRVLDSMAVAKDPAKFKRAAERLYAGLGVPDPRAAAEAWMVRVLDTHAGLDGGEEFMVSSGKPSSSKTREFGPAADRVLREFMQKDPLLVLSDYITGSVRRAEQTRRFGQPGREGSKERAAWLKQHGDKNQWDVMLDKMREEARASGQDGDGLIRKVKQIRDGSLGRLGTAGVRVSRAVSTIHAWNQLSTLQKVTLSSVGDLAMGFVRGGNASYGVKHFLTSIAEASKLVEAFGKRDLSDAHRWAEAMGTVGHGTASQLIQARMDSAPGAVKHANLLNKFYHKVGIEQLTQGGRVAATQNARTFLETLSGDLLSKSARTRQRADLYLKELGIKDPQSFGQWLRTGGTPDAKALYADSGHAADYATAVVRFADQAVLMPSRAQKPVWANHPVGSLLFALQSYNAAFTQNVLKRVGRLGVEAAKTGDVKLLGPAMGLTAIVAMNALQMQLRTAVFGGKAPDDTESWVWQVLDRAGLFGTASPIVNAIYGTKYHRSLSQSLQGAVVGRALDAGDTAFGLVTENSKNTNTAERKAAGMLYDLAIDPAINAYGAANLRGPLGTAAIMGTGNKAGGALPGDRDAFVDAVAGREKKRVSSGE